MELANLTLLAGKNSAGKSTVIQALLAMYQESISSLAGPYMNIGTVSEVKNRIAGSKKICLEAVYDGYENGTCFYRKEFLNDSKEEKTGTPFQKSMRVLYLTADRVGVKDAYEKSVDGGEHIGVRCEYAFYYLSEHEMDQLDEPDFIYDRTSKLTFSGQVDYWLQRILGYRVRAEEIKGTELIRVAYGNDKLGQDIRPKNVGTGVSYMAEIIIAALSCKKGDLLLIENPEIHLHPSGQAEFVEFMTFLAGNGLQIVLETHSDHIYNGVRRCIRTDHISLDKVKIYFFILSENQLSEPASVELDENGHVKKTRDGLFDQIDKDLDVLLGW
ncbi:MAG: DUF3696 domain-containing protein [Lachnospiraceae bacterium]|nr:DUF3696 domain-containing protein [Lachnospiraceae bacterium]